MENQFKQRLEADILKEDDFPRDIKILALQIHDKSGEISGNTFIPVVLFNRDETIKLIREWKNDLEKMSEVI